MKYMIHSCEARLWYVDNYLIPSMLAQGIKEEDIYNYIDTKHEGNLVSWVVSCHKSYEMWGEQNVWHLQDDVIICRDFKERTEQLESQDGIVCAFTCCYDEANIAPGLGTPKNHMWWSFPCIRIPNKIAKEMAVWADIYVWRDSQFGFWIRRKKGDDLIFKVFVESYYPNEPVLNLAPNLVDHIDYLLGGSTVNKQRTQANVRSLYFDDTDLVNDLMEDIANDTCNRG